MKAIRDRDACPEGLTDPCVLTHLYRCLHDNMLLRRLWSRLGAQRPVERNPLCVCASASLSQSVQLHKYESKPRTHSLLSQPWISRTCYLNTLHQQQTHTRRLFPALSGFNHVSSILCVDPGTLSKCGRGQKRFYSSDLVKSMLKSSIKPVTVPGKRVPKGPRTKQPSRANQPSLSDDKVSDSASSDKWQIFFYWWCVHDYQACVFPAGHDAVYCFCNSRSVSFANTLPWFDKPWLPRDWLTERYDSLLHADYTTLHCMEQQWHFIFLFQMPPMCWW